ncbi:MAG: hypothetical protein ACK5K7_04775 [Bacilli bacterium]
MRVLDKIVNFFTYEEDDKEIEKEKEKSDLKKELMEERKKYAKKEKFDTKNISPEEAIEPVKKQVMFVDETFERKEKSVEHVEAKAPRYTDMNEKKFKPSSYISPVHGLLKEAEEVEEYKTEMKTISESDYSKIRDKVFGNSVFADEIEEDKEQKFFATSEIIDLQKRMQIDSEQVMDKDLTVDEAYKRAEFEGAEINSKTFTEGEEENPQYLFDLLDELKEDSKDE